MTRRVELAIKIVFFIYVSACLFCSPIDTAIMIVPLILLCGHSLFTAPKAICVVSENKEIALSIMGNIAKELDIKEIYIFHAESVDEVEGLAVYNKDEDALYELVDDD